MIKDLANRLGIEPALLKAVQIVEAAGRDGFLSDGRPQILSILTNRHRQGIGFIFLELGTIDVKTADLGQYQVGGTRSNEIFQSINDSLGMLHR